MTTMTLPATDPQTATPDGELLRQYGSAASQEAFAEIVRRHVHTVYTSARRQVRDPAAAEDVTQAVFIVLAGKAKKLDGHGSLAGWLMKTTYFASRDVRKRLARRKRHEQAAAQERAMTGGDITMPQITIPHDETISAELDGALAGLKAVDREAVTLRYLQGKSVAETAAALGVNEPAAAKRISRAVERLRERLARRGITSSSIALAVTLEGLPKFHAPAALVHSAAAATAATAPGGAALAKAVVHAMNWAKIKLAAMVVGAAAAAAATTGGAIALVQHEQTPASPPASIPNPAPAPTPVAAQTPVGAAGPAVGALSNGVSIGVMGVREYPAAGNGWWKAWNAVGSPLKGSPLPPDNVGSTMPLPPGVLGREIALHIAVSANGSADSAGVKWSVLENPGNETPCTHVEKSAELVESHVVSISAPGGVLTFHAKIAPGRGIRSSPAPTAREATPIPRARCLGQAATRSSGEMRSTIPALRSCRSAFPAWAMPTSD